MEECTLVFPVEWGKIWLAPKELKVGAGLLNGWGGKKRPKDKSLKGTAIREMGEETDGFYPLPQMLKKYAVLDFYKADKHIFRCHVYLCRKDREGLARWNGELKATREMGQPEVFLNWGVPYEKMMPADREWLPRVLNGERLRGKIYYNADNTALLKPSEYIVVPDGKPLE